MILNYIKLAWRVLSRNKFFTFITLFGISFTLGILMLILSFLQSELGTDQPLTHKNEIIYLDQITLREAFRDTIYKIDTTINNGVMVLDTTIEVKEQGSKTWNGNMNNGIAEEFLSDLPSAESLSLIHI